MWEGPTESVVGIHFVRVEARHAPMIGEFETIEPYLRQDWLLEQTKARQQEQIEETRRGYRIEFVEE